MPNSLKCKIKHLCHNGTITERDRDRILKALEQEPCEDCISRQAAYKCLEFKGDYDTLNEVYERLSKLLPVNTKKTGRWIKKFEDEEERYYCTVCRDYEYFPSKYCPNCGAKMEVKEHDT